MKLYHWCADKFLNSILAEGLTHGCITWPAATGVAVMSGMQWLTTEPSRDDQEWCDPDYSSLPYDRCANRLTLKIPKTSRDRLHRWTDIGPLIVPADHYRLLNSYGKPEDHWLFRGRIPPGWIRAVDRLGEREQFRLRRTA